MHKRLFRITVSAELLTGVITSRTSGNRRLTKNPRGIYMLSQLQMLFQENIK